MHGVAMSFDVRTKVFSSHWTWRLKSLVKKEESESILADLRL